MRYIYPQNKTSRWQPEMAQRKHRSTAGRLMCTRSVDRRSTAVQQKPNPRDEIKLSAYRFFHRSTAGRQMYIRSVDRCTFGR